MKISPERAIELRKAGIGVNLMKVRAGSRDTVDRDCEPVKITQQQAIIPEELMQILARQEEQLMFLASYGKAVAVMAEQLAKPKEKKQWSCSVSRNASGQINNVDIKER